MCVNPNRTAKILTRAAPLFISSLLHQKSDKINANLKISECFIFNWASRRSELFPWHCLPKHVRLININENKMEIICHWNEKTIRRWFVREENYEDQWNFFVTETCRWRKKIEKCFDDFSSCNMAYLTPESESSTTADLSWTQLITPSDKPRPTIVRIDEKPKEMNPEEVQLNPNEKQPRQRRESLMGTFHRHLRQSLKAVSESPGPLTRWDEQRETFIDDLFELLLSLKPFYCCLFLKIAETKKKEALGDLEKKFQVVTFMTGLTSNNSTGKIITWKLRRGCLHEIFSERKN
jgi:hypothetical protein